MQSIAIVLTLLLAVVLSGSLARMARLPLPLVQIALGAVIAVSEVKSVELSPKIFFLLFLPPLLFLDGWRIPKADLFRDRALILELALGLVIFTVLGLGWLIHLLIPEMPLAVAFALAAVVSPTDPIAVSAIAARVPIPKRLMRILGGEALLNDASGLVCMQFAVAAVLTGMFSLSAAVLTLLWVVLAGAAIGVGLTLSVTWVTIRLSRRFGEETGSQILVSLLIPFGAYLLAEHFRCSGILAAVAAGITMSFVEQSGKALGVTRVRRTAVWDTVQFAANGIIFVLLGEQLPGIFAGATVAVRESGHHESWWLAVYVVAICAALAVLRFVWVWAALRLTLFRTPRQGMPPIRPGLGLITAMSLAGVRGAVTLAGVLTLPLVMTNGTPFPGRALAIFLAAGVIILSLVLASLALPRLLKGLQLPPEPSHQVEEDRASIAAATAAIRAVEEVQHLMSEGQGDADLYADVSARIMDLYRQRIDGGLQTGEAAAAHRKMEGIELRMRLAGLNAEREEIFRLGRAREIGDDVVRKMVRELDLMEARYSA